MTGSCKKYLAVSGFDLAVVESITEAVNVSYLSYARECCFKPR